MTGRTLLGLALLAPGCELLTTTDTTPDTDAASTTGETGTDTDTETTGTYESIDLPPGVEMKSDGDGLYTVVVDVPAGATSFQVTNISQKLPALETMEDPDGNVVLNWEDIVAEPRSVTYAIYPVSGVSPFNWPIQEADGPLKPGKYRLNWALVEDNGRYAPDAKVTVSTAIKTDPQLENGEVHVRILWAEGIEAETEVTDAVKEAVEHWRELWASVGITLVERYESSDLPATLDFTWNGGPEVTRASEGKEKGELQLVVGESVSGDEYIYGVSGGIPGTILPSQKTFVVLAWTTHAGVDGVFSENDIMVMGETMAHETGHYMGLFHPVEGTWAQWDALEDTPECTGLLFCNRDLQQNLMYPYSDCTRQGCESQFEISGDQTSVLQRAIPTL